MRRAGKPRKPRREGFANQQLIVLPETVVSDALDFPILGGLMPVAAGYFPAAEHHRVERTEPLRDAIVILCAAGRGWVRIGRQRRENVAAGGLIVIPPGEPHAYGADERMPWSIHWVHLRGSETEEFCRLFQGTARGVVIRLNAGAAARIDFRDVCACLQEDYTRASLMRAAARLRLALSDLHHVRLHQTALVGEDAVAETITWMRENLGARVGLREFARRAGMSVAHYSACFRRKTGYSPIDYFLRMKIQRACQLLDTTSLRVEEIADVVGYPDAFYFSRLFRRVMTKSPRAYRDSLKG